MMSFKKSNLKKQALLASSIVIPILLLCGAFALSHPYFSHLFSQKAQKTPSPYGRPKNNQANKFSLNSKNPPPAVADGMEDSLEYLTMGAVFASNYQPGRFLSLFGLGKNLFLNQSVDPPPDPPRTKSPVSSGNFFIPKSIGGTGGIITGDVFSSPVHYFSARALFAGNYSLGSMIPFVDLRAYRFNGNIYVGEVFVGGRYLMNSGKRLLGAHAFYAFTKGNNGNYNQIGIVMEALGKNLNTRLNAFMPLGASTRSHTCVFDNYVGGYRAVLRQRESSFSGGNLELGSWLLNGRNFNLFAGSGPYYLKMKKTPGIWGGEVRIRPQFKDFIGVDLIVSHDNFYKTVFQAQLIVSIPLYQLNATNGASGVSGMTSAQIYQPLEVFQIVPVGNQCCWSHNW